MRDQNRIDKVCSLALSHGVHLAGVVGFLWVLLWASAPARAGFSLNFSVQHGAPDASHDRYQFYAINDGTNGTGTTLLAEDIELICDQPMVIGLASGTADYLGLSSPNIYSSDRSFVNILGSPGSNGGPTSGSYSAFPGNTTNASTWIGGTTDMEVVMAHIVGTNGTNFGPTATTASNSGQGALIATMVVPTSASLVELIPWGLAGEKGPAYGYFLGGTNPDSLHPFDPTKQYVMPAAVAVPEPGQLAAAALVAAIFLARKRRRDQTTVEQGCAV